MAFAPRGYEFDERYDAAEQDLEVKIVRFGLTLPPETRRRYFRVNGISRDDVARICLKASIDERSDAWNDIYSVAQEMTFGDRTALNLAALCTTKTGRSREKEGLKALQVKVMNHLQELGIAKVSDLEGHPEAFLLAADQIKSATVKHLREVLNRIGVIYTEEGELRDAWEDENAADTKLVASMIPLQP